MPLQGNLNEFSLSQIFQLISLAGKTGSLTVSSKGAEGKIYFREGRVFFAITPQNRIPLGTRLIDAGLISQDDLKEALLCQQEQPEKRLGEILISRGMKKDVLEQFIKEQIEDALFEIFDWKEGSYYFETENIPEEEDIGIYMSVEDILAEATKRQEEWKKIKEVLPSLDTMVQMSEAPGKSNEDIIIKPQEWKVLYLLDKKRSVKDLKDKSHLTSLSLCRILVRMLSNGLLEIVAPKAKEQAMESSGANKAKRYQSTEPITGKYIKNYREESRQNMPLEWASYYARLNEIAHQLMVKRDGEKN